MQVTDMLNEGLSLEFKVNVPGEKIAEDVENSLKEMAKTYKMPGFRDGNVPMSFIKKREGSSLMTKAIEQEIDGCLQKIFKERNIRVATQPSVEVLEFNDEKGLTFHVKLEQFPEVPEIKWEDVELDTIGIKITNQDYAKAYEDILANVKDFEEVKKPADIGDSIIINFKGYIDGEEFEGGSGDEVRLELGSQQFIKGFEEQLVGANPEEERKVEVKFPNHYHKKELSGKDAIFEVKVTKVLKPKHFESVDEEVAKKLGLENLEQLNEAIKEKLEMDFNGISRLRTKKILFDKIDQDNKFDVPASMLKADFEVMWHDLQHQMEQNPDQFKGKSEEELKEEYKVVSARRVRLGLILAEVARKEGIEVTNDEIQYAIDIQAMQNPGGSSWIKEHYKKPENIERLRGPLLEEKVVDFILTKVKINKKEVTSKDFFAKYSDDIKPTK